MKYLGNSRIIVASVVIILGIWSGIRHRMEMDSSVVTALLPVRGGDATLILDAGHGGEDGGAVSLTGIPESGINLSIVLRMEQLLAFCGDPPLLLRREDRSLHTPEAKTLREKKVSDLHMRVATVEAQENAVLLSVHQNSYPNNQTRCHGAQVFYGKVAESQVLAERTQALLRSTLDPENRREAKPIPDSVYLMDQVTCPAVLVECGFLSDPQEEALLRTERYQTELAMVLTAAWLQETAEGRPNQGGYPVQ